jgi:hypothetical protein
LEGFKVAKAIARTDEAPLGDGALILGFTPAQIAQLPVEKLDHLLRLQERVRDDDARKAYNAAMNAAQGEMGRISTDAANPQTRSRYATYAQLDKALRPIYARHGFAVSFNTGDGPEQHVRVLAKVTHRDGHEEPYKVDVPCDGKGAKGNDVMTKTHAVGSAMTYGQRYLLKLIFNVAIGENDDDGNGATQTQTNGLVSEKQADEILRLIRNDDARKTRTFNYVEKVTGARPETVSDIPAKLYGAIVKGLER